MATIPANYDLVYVDELISGADSGTIVAPLTIGFKMISGTGTVLTNQPVTVGNPVNFPETKTGNPLPDIDYVVDDASQMQILGYRYIERT